jgi:hypothetical protein
LFGNSRSWAWALTAAVIAAAVVVGFGLVSAERAVADGCGAACRNAYNQCRIATKGAQSCEGQFTRCMQRCRRK